MSETPGPRPAARHETTRGRHFAVEAETGVRRETVSRYDGVRLANAAKAFPGSTPRLRFAAVYRTAITEKLDAGLTLQRIWQDLAEEYGYGAGYESVKRFVRTRRRSLSTPAA